MIQQANDENKKSFWNIDEPLRNRLTMQIIASVFLIVVSIVATFVFQLGQMMLLLCYLALFMIGKTFFQIYQCLSSKVIRFEGVCTEVNCREILGKKTKNRYIILRTDTGMFIEVDIVNNLKPQVNNDIVFYAPAGAIFQQSEDTFKTNSVYHIYINRRNDTVTNADEQNSN